jgi:hypothetical protein
MYVAMWLEFCIMEGVFLTHIFLYTMQLSGCFTGYFSCSLNFSMPFLNDCVLYHNMFVPFF